MRGVAQIIRSAEPLCSVSDELLSGALRKNLPIPSIACWPSGRKRRKQMPHVDHLWPHLELDSDARRFRAIGETVRIIEQGLGLAYLDQQRRQAFQVGIERRGERRTRIFACQIGRSHPDQTLVLNDRIDRCPGGHRLADPFQIDPRRKANAGARHRQLGVANRDQRGDSQAAAGGITRHGDPVRGLKSLRQQPAIGRNGVFNRGWKRMFRGEAIVEAEHAGAETRAKSAPSDRDGC